MYSYGRRDLNVPSSDMERDTVQESYNGSRILADRYFEYWFYIYWKGGWAFIIFIYVKVSNMVLRSQIRSNWLMVWWISSKRSRAGVWFGRLAIVLVILFDNSFRKRWQDHKITCHMITTYVGPYMTLYKVPSPIYISIYTQRADRMVKLALRLRSRR